jgi:hypothetical protein
MVPGSLVLLGGDPGIGKSTLLLQVADNWRSGAAKCFIFQVRGIPVSDPLAIGTAGDRNRPDLLAE